MRLYKGDYVKLAGYFSTNANGWGTWDFLVGSSDGDSITAYCINDASIKYSAEYIDGKYRIFWKNGKQRGVIISPAENFCMDYFIITAMISSKSLKFEISSLLSYIPGAHIIKYLNNLWGINLSGGLGKNFDPRWLIERKSWVLGASPGNILKVLLGVKNYIDEEDSKPFIHELKQKWQRKEISSEYATQIFDILYNRGLIKNRKIVIPFDQLKNDKLLKWYLSHRFIDCDMQKDENGRFKENMENLHPDVVKYLVRVGRLPKDDFEKIVKYTKHVELLKLYDKKYGISKIFIEGYASVHTRALKWYKRKGFMPTEEQSWDIFFRTSYSSGRDNIKVIDWLMKHGYYKKLPTLNQYDSVSFNLMKYLHSIGGKFINDLFFRMTHAYQREYEFLFQNGYYPTQSAIDDACNGFPTRSLEMDRVVEAAKKYNKMILPTKETYTWVPISVELTRGLLKSGYIPTQDNVNIMCTRAKFPWMLKEYRFCANSRIWCIPALSHENECYYMDHRNEHLRGVGAPKLDNPDFILRANRLEYNNNNNNNNNNNSKRIYEHMYKNFRELNDFINKRQKSNAKKCIVIINLNKNDYTAQCILRQQGYLIIMCVQKGPFDDSFTHHMEMRVKDICALVSFGIYNHLPNPLMSKYYARDLRNQHIVVLAYEMSEIYGFDKYPDHEKIYWNWNM